MCSIELLVANLHAPALTALVLKETKDGRGQDGEHENVACDIVSLLKLPCQGDCLPSAKLTMPPARSTRPWKKLMTSWMISLANLAAKDTVFWTRAPAVVKKDQTSSTREETRSETALMIEDILSRGYRNLL
jgi:hypothetical protein